MIRRMKCRMFAFMLAITAMLLTSILVTLYQTKKMDYEQKSLALLRDAVRIEDGRERDLRGKGALMRKKSSADVMIADQKKDGNIRLIVNEIYGLEEEDAKRLIAQVQDCAEKTGVLREENLRYLSEARGPNGTVRYVFQDIYAECSSLQEQLETFCVIWISALAAFALFFLALLRWTVRPLETVWQQQRQFVADASHELKTPLTVILSNISMLERDAENSSEASRQRMAHIQAEAEHMKQLIQSLLSLARQDAGSVSSTEHTKVDFSYLVNYAVSEFEPVFYEMGKRADSQIAEAVFVSGNEKKLLEVIQILLDNAGKYSEPGSQIEISLKKCLSGRKKELLFCVTSVGAPLTKEELQCVFHRFYRTDSSRGRIEGYGLGLSIADEIVKEHKGRIWAETCSDRGSDKGNCFFVQLPLF